MKALLFFSLCVNCIFAFLFAEGQLQKNTLIESESQAGLQYFLNEVELDARLTFEEQHTKIQEFKAFIAELSKNAAPRLTHLLLLETRSRVIDILQHAALDNFEIKAYLADYEEAILRVQDMNVEIARQMLFFVAELKTHRQYVYDFGILLGCPKKQLLRHDLCKLSADQFEGYARYFRGGRLEENKLAYLAAWGLHQHEEHHHESYSKEGFDFDAFPEDRLRDNMLESVADLLASTKQRGGSTLIDWLVHSFPKKNPHSRLITHFEDALKKAHELYLKSEEDPGRYSIFKGLPCWNPAVEEMFRLLKTTTGGIYN